MFTVHLIWGNNCSKTLEQCMKSFTGYSACIKLDVSTTYLLSKQYNNNNREMKIELQKSLGVLKM